MSKQLHPFLENLLKIISWIPGFKSFTTLLDPPSLEFWFVIPAEIHIQVKERPPTTLKDDRNHFRPMKNPKKSSQWNLFQKPLAPSQCTNTTHFTKGEKKNLPRPQATQFLHQWFVILIPALENNAQSFPPLLFSPTNVQGEKKRKLKTELLVTPILTKIYKAGRGRRIKGYDTHLILVL